MLPRARLPRRGREEAGSRLRGDEFRFWQQVGLFVLGLLARQRFMPGLAIVDAKFVAQWRPLAGEGEDAVRIKALAEAMPPAARALTWQVETSVLGPRTLLK